MFAPPLERLMQNALKSALSKFQATNGSHIETYSTKTLTLNIAIRHDFTWSFIQVNVRTPILKAGITVATFHTHGFLDILDQYTEITQPFKIQESIKISTTSKQLDNPDVFAPQRFSLNKYDYAKKELQKMLNERIRQPICLTSRPGHETRKDGFPNIRRLQETQFLNHPAPYIHDLASGLQSTLIFTKIHLTKAYHQNGFYHTNCPLQISSKCYLA